MVSVKQAPKHYFVELLGSLLLYMVSLYWRHSFAQTHPEPSFLKTLALLSPILPCVLAAAAIIRFYRRMDEMHRRQTLEYVGVGALVCALGSLTLGFSHDLGVPNIGIIWAWPLIGLGWVMASIWSAISACTAENGIAVAARKLLEMVAIVLLPTLAYALAAPVLGWPHRPPALIMVATAMIVGQAGWAIFRRESR